MGGGEEEQVLLFNLPPELLLLRRARIFVEVMTSDRKLKASREGSK